MTAPYRACATNTNLLGCLADLTAIFNHPGRGFHNCQFVSESTNLPGRRNGVGMCRVFYSAALTRDRISPPAMTEAIWPDTLTPTACISRKF